MNRWQTIGDSHAALIENSRALLLQWHERANLAAYGRVTSAFNALTLVMEWQRDYKRGRATFEAWDAALEAANTAIEYLRELCSPSELRQSVITFESEAAYQDFLAGLRRDLGQSLIRTQMRFQPGLGEDERAARAGRIAATVTNEQVLKWAGCSH